MVGLLNITTPLTPGKQENLATQVGWQFVHRELLLLLALDKWGLVRCWG